jgi:hypothetical protein
MYCRRKEATLLAARGDPHKEVSAGDPCIGSNCQDGWANAHRIPVEQDKPSEEQGFYLHPELYRESEQKSLVHGR